PHLHSYSYCRAQAVQGFFFFFFNAPPTPEIYTLSLHDALPITENAKFGQPEVNLGIIPGYGGTQRLTQLLGRGKALELLLTGDMISAQDAHTLGLVNHIVANRDELIALAQKIMGKILAKGPIATANVIRAVNAGFEFEARGYEAEASAFADCAETDDFREGTAAFLEKRPPSFKGK